MTLAARSGFVGAPAISYHRAMRPVSILQPGMLWACLGTAALAAFAGTAIAMWMDKGAQLYLALIETGMAWCL